MMKKDCDLSSVILGFFFLYCVYGMFLSPLHKSKRHKDSQCTYNIITNMLLNMFNNLKHGNNLNIICLD